MNKSTHSLIFNSTRGCMMAVAETASSSSKNPSGTSRSLRSASKYAKPPKNHEFTPSKVPPTQWIRAQAAPDLIVFTAKRLGDGFYEQRLINEQVGQLTGRRFLSNFTSAEQQCQSLMNSGITVAKAFKLQPGIALSAAQMAQLTSDIVWLVEQSVTLPDGSITRALVPQLYIAKLQPGDLSGAGALLAGREVNINMTGDVTNSGTIAGRTVLSLAANNLQNIGGIINADKVSVNAANDINNTGGRISAQDALTATAGRDINITSTSQSSATQVGASSFSRTSIDRIAGLYVTNPSGTLVASAGRDVNITAGGLKPQAQQEAV